MPSIKGIEIKDFYQEETHRGIAFGGLLYIEGKQIGSFENKGVGGATNVVILNEADNREQFSKRVKDYYEEFPAEGKQDAEQFIDELMALDDDFQVFKRQVEPAGKILVALKSYTRMTPVEELSMEDLGSKYFAVSNDEQVASLVSREKPKEYKVYSSSEDFNN